ncbi:peroxiredoxin family protein [Nodosilinea sp. PGN35]|uniref:peroxiredoxin family protein n=1 Tax=Nodosilinea sp. PGN35 TaxID=3020489 RepID=UPI0023B31941|nr:redoxin domain-containing protein [Nodosilinea sp. TSF1-S3]MDF0369086.1 redoxin domain-containing protein [Nodosilinea sp. TSF1-S3]
MASTVPRSDLGGAWHQWVPLPPRLGLPLAQIPPDFALWDVTYRRTVRLANYRGKQPVVLVFCRLRPEPLYSPQRWASLVALNRAYDQFRNAGAEVLLIGSQPQRQLQAVVEDLSLTVPLLCDPSGASFRAYSTGQALGAPLPAQFVLDAQGRLRHCRLFSLLNSTVEPAVLLAAVERL